jgi:soluble lytic murein transglycosylase-like protein/TolA-binding protein
MRRFVFGAVGVAVLAFVAGTGCLQAASRRSSSPSAHAAVSDASRDARQTFVDAVTRYERGDLAPAGAAFRTLVDAYPALGDYHLAYLAAIADRTGQPAEASKWDDRLLTTHPESIWIPTALARHARIAAALGDPRAEELAKRARDAGTHDPNARGWGLAVLAGLRAPTRPREAYELYQEARRVGGEAASVGRDGCRALAARHPELLQDPALTLAEGRLLALEGDAEGAMAHYRTAAERGTGIDRIEALRALAKALQSTGRLEDALATYRSAVAAGPSASLARFELATLLWNRDRDAEAETLFTEILAESPRHAKYETAQYALARIAEGDGRTDEAILLFRRLAAEGGESDLAREARWRLAWIPYQRGDLAVADAEFAALGAGSAKDRAASFYWRARVAARRNDTGAQRALLAEVLRESPDGYYADLAERELGAAAPSEDPPTPLALREPPPSIAMRHYHWSRSVELRAIGMDAAAARELLALTRELPDEGTHEPYLLQAYTDVGATTRALRLAVRFGASDIPPATLAAYQYPRAYWTQVRSAADAERLDPYAVLALMRQESLFDPNAVSPAAAYGLMQLLVPTASRVAGHPVERASLFEPATNIELGTRYLRQLLDRYHGDLAKALAAYNGGEEAVAKWERRAPGAPTDEFVETISYRETRQYVKTVLGNYRRYRRLYGAPGEERARERALYDAAGNPSAASSLPPSPPNPPFDIITTTSPDAA